MNNPFDDNLKNLDDSLTQTQDMELSQDNAIQSSESVLSGNLHQLSDSDTFNTDGELGQLDNDISQPSDINPSDLLDHTPMNNVADQALNSVLDLANTNPTDLNTDDGNHVVFASHICTFEENRPTDYNNCGGDSKPLDNTSNTNDNSNDSGNSESDCGGSSDD